MKLTACSVLLATWLVASSAVVEAQEPSQHISRRHHAKVQHELEKRGIFSGQATWYGWTPSSMGACGSKLPENGFYVALNHAQYGNMNQQSPMCNKKITITDGKKTTQATILDACPGDGSTCKWGALDMSKPLFNYFNDFGVGIFNMRWWVDGEGGSDSGSGSGGSNNDNDNSSKSDSSDDEAAQRAAAAKKAQDAKDAKEAAEKKAQEEKEQKEKEEKEEAAKKAAAKKKAAEEKKKKEEEEKKKEAAAKKKAAKKAKAEKIRTAQHQNIAAFGEIMQTLNQIVESAGGQGSSGSSSASSSA